MTDLVVTVQTRKTKELKFILENMLEVPALKSFDASVTPYTEPCEYLINIISFNIIKVTENSTSGDLHNKVIKMFMKDDKMHKLIPRKAFSVLPGVSGSISVTYAALGTKTTYATVECNVQNGLMAHQFNLNPNN